MKYILTYCFLFAIGSQSLCQDGFDLKEQILGSWEYESFELSSHEKDYYGLQEEPVVYFWFTEKSVILRGSCNTNNERYFGVDNIRYSSKRSNEEDMVVLKLKGSDVLKSCGDVEHIKIVSCNDSILTIKSFINDGIVKYRRIPTPTKVAIEAHNLIIGHWKYEKSFGFNSGIKIEKSNSRDSIVSFSFSKDSVQIKFINDAFKPINTTYTIKVEPYFNWISITLKDVEELYCIQITPLNIGKLDNITSSHFCIHMCGTDVDEVYFVRDD